MAIYFISDFHLGSDSREAEKRKFDLFCTFVQQCRHDMDRLIVLGDMFDFWFEYRHLIPKRNLHLLFKMHELVRAGVSISYLAGNHDHWMDDFLDQELGIELVPDRLEIDTPHGKLLAVHGDGLAKPDWSYRLLKRILRNRVNIGFYRLLPPVVAFGVAHLAARRSRRRSSHRAPETFIDGYIDYAKEKFAEGYYALVCGHTHHPEIRDIDGHYYVNSGDWIRHYSYVRFDGDRFELKYMEKQS
jgi:UDP-2,3-diacylglucosamine hydrolase